MTLVVGSVVELRAGRSAGGPGHSVVAKACIIWRVIGDDVIWVRVSHSKGPKAVRHRADIVVTGAAEHAAAGFPMARPVIECRKLLRAPLSMFEGRPVLGNVTAALMAEIAAMQIREARRLAGETRLVA